MHELSLALAILDCAAEQSALHNGARVLAVHLKLGPLSGVVREALCSAYDLAREHSECPDSRLVIEDVPLIAYCPTCDVDREIPSPQELTCPVCHTPTPEIRRGREFEVVAMEIEEPEAQLL